MVVQSRYTVFCRTRPNVDSALYCCLLCVAFNAGSAAVCRNKQCLLLSVQFSMPKACTQQRLTNKATMNEAAGRI